MTIVRPAPPSAIAVLEGGRKRTHRQHRAIPPRCRLIRLKTRRRWRTARFSSVLRRNVVGEDERRSGRDCAVLLPGPVPVLRPYSASGTGDRLSPGCADASRVIGWTAGLGSAPRARTLQRIVAPASAVGRDSGQKRSNMPAARSGRAETVIVSCPVPWARAGGALRVTAWRCSMLTRETTPREDTDVRGLKVTSPRTGARRRCRLRGEYA